MKCIQMDFDGQKAAALLIALIMCDGVLSIQYPDESFLTSCITPGGLDVESVSLDAVIAAQDKTNLTVLNHNRTYIFTVPSDSKPQRNCSGNVRYIELCYQQLTAASENEEILRFLSLNTDTSSISLAVENKSCIEFESMSEEEESTTPSPSRHSILYRILCKFFCFWCSCGGSSDDTENSAPPVSITACCARATPNTSLTIPSSPISFRINPSNHTNVGGFVPFSNYSIFNCSSSDCSSNTTIPYVPLIRFYIGSSSTVGTTDGNLISTSTTSTTQEIDSTIQTTQELDFTIQSITTDKPETIDEEDNNLSKHFTTEKINAETQPESSGIGAAIAGGVIGGIVAIILIVLIVIVSALIAVVNLKPKRKRACSELSLTQGLVLDNAVYDEVSREGGPQFPNVNYAGIDYAEGGVVYSKPYKNRKIYVAPARDEVSLYAQLKDINTMNLRREFIILGAELGSGQFGVVYKGELENRRGERRKMVAVKTLREGANEEEKIKFLQEAAIMGQFKHPNVISMYGIVTDGEPILLVLELLEKGDLRSYLLHMNSEEGEIESADECTLLNYCRQVASGMAYLSNKAFIHRDLAARNVLVSDENICKIADFGMSRDLMKGSYYVSRGGKIPVKWTAPEALHYKKYSTASDIWSYGAVMYEIWSLGHRPFEGYDNNRVLGLIGNGYRLAPPPGCPRAIYRIMIQCWHLEASERPKFQDVIKKLSLPDQELLRWSEEDKAVHPEAAKLGADLLSAQELYKDLQTTYSHLNG